MRQWMLNRIRSKKMPYILSFFIPLCVMAAVCILHGIYPFGENSFLHIDMYHQYAPFFMEFLHKLKNHESLLYSWNLGIGSDFVATYAYYLASPVNWLVVFCPEKYLIEFMTVLVLLKIAFGGLFFALYLGKHFKSDSYLVTLVSMFYALSAFVSAYSWNIMWLDCIMLAPVIILALERLVYERKCYLYCILLAISILSNYYISIMICIFLVLYFFLMQIELTQKAVFVHDRQEEPGLYRKEVRAFRRENIFDFTLYSLLAGALGAVLLIPELIVLGYSGSGGISFPDEFSWYFSVFDELARQCVGVTVYTGREHWPNLYCGTAVLLLIVLYILNRKISWKKKILRILLLAFFLISFANNWLDFIWHGLHFPDSLPGRQSFLYIFVLLALCFDTLKNWNGSRIWHIGIAAAVCAVFLGACAIFTDHNLVSLDAILMTAVLAFGYTLLFLMAKIPKCWSRKVIYIFALFLTITETGLNMDLTGVVTTNRIQYTKNLPAYKELTEQAAEENDGFYRTEKWDRMTKNESCLTGYQSASLFSSLMNYSVGTFYRELGMEGGKNFYCYNGATPLTSAMLSVKYMLTASDAEESPLRTLVGESDGMYLYENKYCLPLGFMVPADLEEQWDFKEGTAILTQNSLAQELGAQGNLLNVIPLTKEGKATVIRVQQTGYIYVSYLNNEANTITATVGRKTRTYTKCSHIYMLDLGWCEAGTVIRLTCSETDNLMAQAYQLDLDSLDTVYNTLNQQTMTLDDYTDTRIKGHIEVSEPGKLVLSIPCEEGWTLYVDGKETEKELFLNSLIGVTLPEGSHDIELRYETPGLKAGAAISLGAAAVFLLIIGKQRYSDKRKKILEK